MVKFIKINVVYRCFELNMPCDSHKGCRCPHFIVSYVIQVGAVQNGQENYQPQRQ